MAKEGDFLHKNKDQQNSWTNKYCQLKGDCILIVNKENIVSVSVQVKV